MNTTSMRKASPPAPASSRLWWFVLVVALAQFRATAGWKAGVDGSVALATLGAGGGIDSNTLREPVIGFIFSNEGLMYNLTFEGSKISRLDK